MAKKLSNKTQKNYQSEDTFISNNPLILEYKYAYKYIFADVTFSNYHNSIIKNIEYISGETNLSYNNKI